MRTKGAASFDQIKSAPLREVRRWSVPAKTECSHSVTKFSLTLSSEWDRVSSPRIQVLYVEGVTIPIGPWEWSGKHLDSLLVKLLDSLLVMI